MQLPGEDKGHSQKKNEDTFSSSTSYSKNHAVLIITKSVAPREFLFAGERNEM